MKFGLSLITSLPFLKEKQILFLPRELILCSKTWVSHIHACLFVCSVSKLCPTLCSTPGFPVLHYIPDFASTHVHWVIGAIQASHRISPPPLTISLSQYQGLFQWVSFSHQMARVLELLHQSFQWIFRIDFLLDWLVWSPCSSGDSQESSPTPKLGSINFLTLSLLNGLTLTSIYNYWKIQCRPLSAKWCLYFLICVQVCHSFPSRK